MIANAATASLTAAFIDLVINITVIERLKLMYMMDNTD
jgi:hypothetical protein